MAPERRAGCRRTPRSSPERGALWFGEGGGCGAGCCTAWRGCHGGLPEVAVAPTEKVGHPRRSLDRGCCRVRGKGSRLMAVMDIAEGLRGEEERRLMEMASRLEGVRLSLEMCEHGVRWWQPWKRRGVDGAWPGRWVRQAWGCLVLQQVPERLGARVGKVWHAEEKDVLRRSCRRL